MTVSIGAWVEEASRLTNWNQVSVHSSIKGLSLTCWYLGRNGIELFFDSLSS
jgi:hypothetical protein